MCGTATSASANATTPTGALIQNTHGQPQVSVMMPPSTGPMRIAIGKAAPMIAMYFGRCRGVVTSAMIVCDISWRPAELIPWITRATISQTMPFAKPHAIELRMNTATELRNTARGPIRSPSFPRTGSRTVLASV